MSPSSIYYFVAAVVSLSAVLSYLNDRLLKLPRIIGLTILSLAVSLLLRLLDTAGVQFASQALTMVHGLNFSKALIVWVLGFLMFGGALNIDLEDVLAQKWSIGFLALFGTALSTLLVGVAVWLLLAAFGLGAPFPACLLFGAVISPTDPVAVLGMVHEVHRKRLEIEIAGEALFNDGMGIVLFTVLSAHAAGGEIHPVLAIGELAWEVMGGLGLGILLAVTTQRAFRGLDDFQEEVLLTLGLATGGYALGMSLRVSGPMALAAAGLCLSHGGLRLPITVIQQKRLRRFWKLIEELLSTLIFVVVGCELALLSLDAATLACALLAIPVCLGARLVTVWGSLYLAASLRPPDGPTLRILTWGGLRGAISVALALALPEAPWKNTFIALTFVVVAFSVLAQGLTLRSALPPPRV